MRDDERPWYRAYVWTDAIRRDDADRVRQLIAASDDVNERLWRMDETPLMDAAQQGSTAVVRALLANGAEVDTATPDGITAAQVAYGSFCGEALRALVAAGADMAFVGEPPASQLCIAAMTGDCDRLQALAAEGADVDAPASFGRTALMCAAGAGQTECVRALLELGADVEATDDDIGPDYEPEQGITALAYAAMYGYTEVVAILLDRGANPNRPLGNGSTALNYATVECNTETARLLLERGADVRGARTADTYRDSPLAAAAWMGCEETVALLLAHGAAEDRAALQDAMRSAYIDNGPNTVPLLLAAGARFGLAEAAYARNQTVLREGIAMGADVNERDEQGWTPLMHAAYGVQPPDAEIVRLLIEAGADPTVRRKDGVALAKLMDHDATPAVADMIERAAAEWERAHPAAG